MAEQLSIQLDLIFETVFNELFPELRKLYDKAENFGPAWYRSDNPSVSYFPTQMCQ
ncbi:hypothetical protein DAPPUDRAFT_320740 [Daphnia pulex]|uniref:Uncharacterized protein n=1 Tax=Daphnia pulex TaxID=6669 RepID=E9GQ51_DAPPU|nr:hypothetical protein DAPPUDRAFT_320740 [Daphnia pulex]|eukprot:EFX78230.1 hypothetical protein DAPPUDRAFT_320740 [Daphnia pulex]